MTNRANAVDGGAVAVALAQQAADPEAHDVSLIRERLRWTPEQRLDANTRFLEFYLAARPSGPRVSDDQ